MKTVLLGLLLSLSLHGGEVTNRVNVVLVEMQCARYGCAGTIEYQDGVRLRGYRHIHKCNQCGTLHDSNKKYPIVTYVKN